MERLRDFLLQGVKEGVFPGATYAIIYNGKVSIDVVGNKALIPRIEKNEIDTVYDLASLTKVVVTTPLICMLIEEGKLHLHDTLECFFANIQNQQMKEITIWHLLTHTSGLPATTKQYFDSKESFLNGILSMKLISKIGEEVHYSDLGFILLGEIIEKVSGKALDLYSKEKLFVPLKMMDTCFCPKDKLKTAPTEVIEDIPLRGMVHGGKAQLFGGVAGHSGLFSTILDMTHFVNMILHKGTYQGKRILSCHTIDLWRIKCTKETNHVTRTIGWISGRLPKITGRNAPDGIISHSGFTGGSIVIDIEHQFAFILLTNRIHPSRDNKKIDSFREKMMDYIWQTINVLDK